MGTRGAPDGQEGARDSWLVWAIFLIAVFLIVGRPWQASDVPAALPPASARPSSLAAAVSTADFSATRAWTHLDALATKLGRRVAGTDECARAADYIEGQLRSLGVETERQVASGSEDRDGTTHVYRGVENVLARIPGEGRPAILVSTHYDSAVEGPGAGDNALNVAVALEIVRAMVVSGVPRNSIIFNFNGAEELGLLGAAAFVRHPWFADVRTFINLDASGPGGRQLLLQVAPGHDDLLEAYAASAPHVHGTVLAQEIFQVLPLDTDYHVYRDAGLGGVDLAPYGDGYAYHTALDRTERVSRRTLQESGENVLALVRQLTALSPIDQREVAAPATYYDLLGLVMVHYSARTAQSMGFLIVALGVILVTWPRAGERRAVGMIVLGTIAVGVSVLLAILVPILGSVVVTWTGQKMFWFARPWLALCVYGTLTVVGVLAGQSLLRSLARRRGLAAAVVVDAVRRGLVVGWALLLLVATALRLGAGYLPLWWCAGSAIAFVASRHLDGARRRAVTLAGMTLAAVTTMQASELLLTCMVPLTGVLGRDVSADGLIAAIAAVSVAPFALVMAPLMQSARSLRRAGACAGGAVVVLAGLVVWSFPYTPERPKRAYLDVRSDGEAGTRVVVETIDSGPDLAINDASLGAEIARPRPAIEVVPAASAVSGPRPVEIHLAAPGAYLVDVRLDGGPITWRIGERTGTGKHIAWVGTGDPLTVLVEAVAGAPVHIRAKAFYAGSDVSVDHVLAQLPPWSTPTVQTVLETSADF